MLESMLLGTSGLGTSGLGGKDLKGKGKGREVVGEVEGDDEEEGEMVDGGEVVGDGVGRNRRRKGGSGGSTEGTDELERTTEGILTSFRQGRILKDALPLSLVVSLFLFDLSKVISLR